MLSELGFDPKNPSSWNGEDRTETHRRDLTNVSEIPLKCHQLLVWKQQTVLP